MKKINIAFVCDENYTKYMMVTIKSILKNIINRDIFLHVFILNTGITRNTQNYISKTYSSNENIEMRFINVEMSSFENYKLKTHVSASAFSKIYIADLINEERVIYLDCDLIVNENIEYLWDKFENDIVLKAVWNPNYNYDNKYIGLSYDSRTFNSGVMLLNLKLMRKMDSSIKLLYFLNKYNDKTKLHDQAAFNAIFKDNWKELDYEWNYQVSMILPLHTHLSISKDEYFELYNEPSIIHFSSNSKPWQLRNAHPYKNKFKTLYLDTHNRHLNYRKKDTISILKKMKENIMYKKAYFSNRFLS